MLPTKTADELIKNVICHSVASVTVCASLTLRRVSLHLFYECSKFCES